MQRHKKCRLIHELSAFTNPIPLANVSTILSVLQHPFTCMHACMHDIPGCIQSGKTVYIYMYIGNSMVSSAIWEKNMHE